MVVVLGITVAGYYQVRPLPLQTLPLRPARVMMNVAADGSQVYGQRLHFLMSWWNWPSGGSTPNTRLVSDSAPKGEYVP